MELYLTQNIFARYETSQYNIKIASSEQSLLSLLEGEQSVIKSIIYDRFVK